VDVAAIVDPALFQTQIDGGVAMGYGFACLEDLDESEGRVWAATLGEFRLPTSADVPAYKTVLVRGGLGVGRANVKSIGESTTPPVAAAIANAVYDATGARIRALPLTARRVYEAMEALR
jgi:CO/xanthine dehydrogenase Mo-binding subunit